MTYPTLDEIEALHSKYAPSPEVHARIRTHCQIIWEIAEQLINHNQLTVDAELVRTGALLHDIGVYSLLESDGTLKPGISYITHGIAGEAILKAEGLSEAIWRFTSNHTGVGLTKDEITQANLPLPLADYVPQTDEEWLVAYADKFHSKNNPPSFNSYEWYKHEARKFGADNVRIFEQLAVKFGKPELAQLALKYKYTIREIN